MTDSSLIASVTGKYMHSFAGVIDSVIEITVSDSNTILLSKKYGLIDFLPFSHYFRNDSTSKFTLYNISADTVFPEIPGFKEIFDFQVGDEFHYLAWGQSSMYDKKEKQVVLSRFDSQAGDSIRYVIDREKLESNPVPTVYTRDTITVIYTLNNWTGQMQEITSLTALPSDPNEVMVKTGIKSDTSYNMRISNTFVEYYSDSACYPILYLRPQNGYSSNFTAGLGQTYYRYYSIPTIRQEFLVYYRKGLESAGTPLSIVSREDETALMHIAIYPNPVSDLIQFSGLPLGQLEVRIVDLSGKTVFHSFIESSGGVAQLNANEIPPGLFILYLYQEKKTLSRKKIIKIKD